jgi:hypothetical protein
MKPETNHARGLPAIQESRERRKRFPAIPPRYLLWGFLLIVAWAVFYWKQTQNEIESWKAKLFARQRGVAAELGPKVEPLRDRIEQWVLEAAKPYAEDVVTPEVRDWDFGALPGIYLRLKLADASDVKRVRRAADDSLRDGFTSCLFHEPNPNPTSGPACHASRDCPTGTFCNEVDHCVAAAQPYNMRAVYRGIRVLTEEWTVALRTASDDMRMRLLDREFESAVLDDIPLAVDVMARAQFFMLVLDEAPASAKPDVALEDLQAMPHPARVSLWGLKPGRERVLLRLRREMDARFVAAGERATTDAVLAAAQQRQVNSCQLALHVRAALAP